MSAFSQSLVRWQPKHGRHGLPWQGTRDPYRVWLSEIMLQQTQVATALPYYLRFLDRFPDVQSLAQAPVQDVLALWSGLGYYSRARNLHKCAQQVCQLHGGMFPQTAHELQALSGIGPSTAAAVAAFCHGERISILDGNVKRVLSRHVGIADDISRPAGTALLAQTAADLLPGRAKDMPVYTQALMDLGATVCTPRNPQCPACPVEGSCVANAQGMQSQWPVKVRRALRTSHSWWLVWLVRSDGAVWLQRRPDRGIWAGLHAPPVLDSEAALQALASEAQLAFVHLPVRKHVLTHRDLYLHDMRCEWRGAQALSAWPGCDGQWYVASQWQTLGLPAPVQSMLEQLAQYSSNSR
jgi:A/G-specific adenine glycosylase